MPNSVKAGATVLADADHPEMALLRVHIGRDVAQPVFVLAEHLGDTGDGEDVRDCSHGQAAWLAAVPADRQFHGSSSSRR